MEFHKIPNPKFKEILHNIPKPPNLKILPKPTIFIKMKHFMYNPPYPNPPIWCKSPLRQKSPKISFRICYKATRKYQIVTNNLHGNEILNHVFSGNEIPRQRREWVLIDKECEWVDLDNERHTHAKDLRFQSFQWWR